MKTSRLPKPSHLEFPVLRSRTRCDRQLVANGQLAIGRNLAGCNPKWIEMAKQCAGDIPCRAAGGADSRSCRAMNNSDSMIYIILARGKDKKQAALTSSNTKLSKLTFWSGAHSQ